MRKRLAILLATGVLALSPNNKSNATEENRNVRIEETSKDSVPCPKEIDVDERVNGLKFLGKSGKILEEWKNDEEFISLLDDLITMKKAKKLYFDEKYDKFIKSIYINGDAVKIEFVYGMNMVVGNTDSLYIADISLDKFVITDLTVLKSRILLDIKPDKEAVYNEIPIQQLPEQYWKLPEFKTLNLNLSNIEVNDELRLQVEGMELKDDIIKVIDITKCKNISLYKYKMTNELINILEEDGNLNTLILTYPNFEELGNEFNFKSKALKKIAIQMDGREILDKINLNQCTNLEGFSGGMSTSLEDLNGIKECNKLTYFSLGDYIYNHDLDYIEDIEEQWEKYCFEKRDTDYFAVAMAGTNNFIEDISALKEKNIEILNISYLKNVSSEDFKDVVYSLTNLKKIIGYEIANATLYDEELVKYLNEKGIEHPFTDVSKEIKEEIKSIVESLITENMTDFQKVETISKYVLEHLEYDHANLNNYPISKSHQLREQLWSKSLYYITMANMKENEEKNSVDAICYGYSSFTNALYIEAGVKAFMQETTGHIYNLVNIDNVFYKVDLTSLDEFIKKQGIQVKDYDFKINSEDYMIKIGLPNTETSQQEPLRAKQQKEKMKEKEKQDVIR